MLLVIFSPPAEGNKDIQQIQEDLEQEKEDNKQNPDEKKTALINIIADYNDSMVQIIVSMNSICIIKMFKNASKIKSTATMIILIKIK